MSTIEVRAVHLEDVASNMQRAQRALVSLMALVDPDEDAEAAADLHELAIAITCTSDSIAMALRDAQEVQR